MPPQSANNCVQTLSQIPNGELRRSINGNPLFLKVTDQRRYRSVILCRDANVPPIDGIHVGARVNVGCIIDLWQSILPGETSVALSHAAVDGSVNAITLFGTQVEFLLDDERRHVILQAPLAETVHVHFRPWMLMLVTDFCMETDEWAASGGWKLTLEEIYDDGM
jgi:hypothetical protein